MVSLDALRLRYLYVFFNTKDDGPVVLDLPPAANGSSFLGTICDAWQVPLTDVGFEGKGGKYLILPPDFTGRGPNWLHRRAFQDLQHLFGHPLHLGEQFGDG
jgi:hypothetical protein